MVLIPGVVLLSAPSFGMDWLCAALKVGVRRILETASGHAFANGRASAMSGIVQPRPAAMAW